jgi:mitochondrial distribution and morphology protein 31
VDVVLDIKFPTDRAGKLDVPLNVILGEIADAISAAAAASSSSGSGAEDRIPGQRELAKPPLTAPPSTPHPATPTTPTTTIDDGTADDTDNDTKDKKKKADEPKVIIDIDLRFRDLKAAVPIFTNDLSYVNMALIRPIVYFMK